MPTALVVLVAVGVVVYAYLNSQGTPGGVTGISTQGSVDVVSPDGTQQTLYPPPWISASDWSLVVQAANGQAWLAYLLAAIGWHETHWGQLGAGQQGYVLGYGVLSSTDILTQYQGVAAQVGNAAPALASYLGGPPITEGQLVGFATDVWKPGDPVGWGADVYNTYAGLVANAGMPALAA